MKRVCASLRFLPPLSETSVGAASGDGSASTPEIYDTLVPGLLYSKQTGGGVRRRGGLHYAIKLGQPREETITL